MKFELPKLSYELDALEPHISKETLEYHHLKHHATYVKKLNDLILGTEYEDMGLEEIIKNSEGGIFNNAAQIWNHTFYFNCLSPKGGGKPEGSLSNLIDRDFGSFEDFKKKFSESAITNFGSGWTWLVLNNDKKLEILSTSNAETPIITNKKLLLTIDVWEHAYYLDYKNVRASYVESFFEVINWDFVVDNLNF